MPSPPRQSFHSVDPVRSIRREAPLIKKGVK
jgi:hypothetical protein